MTIDFSKYFVLEDYKALNPDLKFSSDSEYLEHWNYIGIHQLRLFNRKLIDIDCEFSHEANFFSPYFTYLYKNNLLDKSITVSSHIGMEPFYIHLIDKISIEFKKQTRETCLISWFILDHHIELYQDNKFLVLPDYRNYFKNNTFKFLKPLLLITNKYQQNALDHQLYYKAEIVLELFDHLKDKYQIIYLQSPPYNQTQNYSIEHLEIPILDMSTPDFDYFGPEGIQKLKKIYTDIIFFDDLLIKHNIPYNELLLKVSSNCSNYICHPGGLSEIFARFFAKKIICWEFPYQVAAVQGSQYITAARFVTTEDLNNLVVMKQHCQDLFL